MAVAALTLAGISLGIAVVTAYFTRGQLQQAKKANDLPTAIGMFREFRGKREARRIALAELPPGVHPMKELRDDVIELIHLLDNIGMLVAEDLVSAELVAGYMGDSVIALWDKLGPSLEADRKRRRDEGESDAFQMYFQYLARRMREVDPAKVRAKLAQ